MGRRSPSTCPPPEPAPGSSCCCSDPDFSFSRVGSQGQESPLAPDPHFWLGGIQGFRTACQRDTSICKTWSWSPSLSTSNTSWVQDPNAGSDPALMGGQTHGEPHVSTATSPMASVSHRSWHNSASELVTGRLKERSPQSPPAWAPHCLPFSPPSLPRLRSQAQQEDCVGQVLLLQSTLHKPWYFRGRFGHQGLSTNSPKLDGNITIVSSFSLQQGCLELVLGPKLSAVLKSKAAPNMACVCTAPCQCCHHPTAERPLQLRCSTLTLVAIFSLLALPALEQRSARADVSPSSPLSIALPIPGSHPLLRAPADGVLEGQELQTRVGGQWEHGGKETRWMGTDIHLLKENLRCRPDPALTYTTGGCLLPAPAATGAACTQQPGSAPSCLLGALGGGHRGRTGTLQAAWPRAPRGR